MQEGEKIDKVRAGFDRTCVITDKGNAYIWGGEDLRAIGAHYHQGIENLREQVDKEYRITDVGLGYAHTIVLVDK